MILTKIFYLILGVSVVFALAFAWSSDRKNIKYRYLFIILGLQLLLGYFILQSNAGVRFVSVLSSGFDIILQHSHEGAEFVFGSLADMDKYGFVFFFNVGLSIVLISAIIGTLQHFKILPVVVKYVGFLLSKITGMGKMEAFNAVSSITVGQQENFLVYRNLLDHLPSNVLYTLAATAMSTVSLAIAGSYMAIIDPKYVCVAILLNMIGTFFVLHIINPYDNSDNFDFDKLQKDYETKKSSFFEMLANYMFDGFKIAVIVSAVLIGYIALLDLINVIFTRVIGISFTQIIGYIFYPLAWVLNIHGSETMLSSQIMGTKIVTNEFVAMQDLAKHSKDISEHTKAVVSVFLVSFANFSSIGVIIGAVQALSKDASIKIAQFGIKILYGAALVSLLSASVVGFIV